jgi:hypothetical protein
VPGAGLRSPPFPDDRGQELLNRVQPQVIGTAIEEAGIECRNRRVNDVAEPGLARELFDLGRAVVAGEAPVGTSTLGANLLNA